MALFSEHRRRNVFKVASVYLISAWVLLQVFDVVSPYLHFPVIIGTITIVAFLIGFPVICIFAFVFEVTPNGLKRIRNDIDESHALDHAPKAERMDRKFPAAPCANQSTLSAPGEFPGLQEIKKLAVLPLSNMIDDPGTNFLGFALADQIIGSMSYSKNVLVRASSTIRQYQNEVFDIREIGTKLNVNYVLAGSYLKQDDTIRLNIELVDIESGEMIWRESIEIEYKNVFELQDIVSQKVVHGLRVQFSTEERERMKPETPQSAAVYELYLRSVSFPFTVEGNEKALELLDTAISLDPLYAPSYLERGTRYIQMSQVGKDTVLAQVKAEENFLKSLSLKDTLLPAYANLGMLYTDSGKHGKAHTMLIKALQINPNSAWLHFAFSYHYRYIGFLEDSRQEMEIALHIDPRNPQFRSCIVTYMFLGKYKEILESFDLDAGSPFTLNYLGEVALRNDDQDLAIEYFEKVLKIKNERSEYYFASSMLEYLRGNLTKATEFNRKREGENPADSEIWYEVARLYGLYENNGDCHRALKKSIEMGYVSYPSMQTDAFLDPVRGQPGIRKLLARAEARHEELKASLVTEY